MWNISCSILSIALSHSGRNWESGVDPAAAESFYVTPETGLVVLVLWLVVPLLVGYSRFTKADL
jgi:ABC-2 type transport system permease protein